MTLFNRVGLFPNRPLTLLMLVALLASPVWLGARQTPAPMQQILPSTAQTDVQTDLNRDWSNDVPAHLAVVDGSATLERDGRAEAATENIALLAGDRLRTDRGRVDVLFADGSALDLDQNTAVEFLSDELLRLGAGRIRVTLTRATPNGYRIDSAGTTSFLLAAGEYRLNVGDNRSSTPEVTLTVARGTAELSTASGRTVVRAGMAARAIASADPSLPYTVAVSSWEPFDRWADDQRNARVGVESARYLPEDLRYYGGDFDRYGTWGYVAPYGNVWYPSVGVGWQPYYNGGWSFYASFGWMWAGAGSWVWPTHHYGRWGYGSSWYWIPDHYWGPSWVAWGGYPGYVGWCPLGYNNRPVFSYAGGVAVGRYGAGRGWAVAPARSFAAGTGVRAAALDAGAIGPEARSRFAEGRAPGRPAGFSANANSAPVRAPSVGTRGMAMSRNGDRATATGAGSTNSPRASGVAAGDPSRFPRDVTPRSTSGWSATSPQGRVDTSASPSARSTGPSRIAGPSRVDSSDATTRTWTPSDRTPSRTVDPTGRFSNAPGSRSDASPADRSVPRTAEPRAGQWGPSRDRLPMNTQPLPSSPRMSTPSTPSRTWSSPSGEWRSVAPTSRPSGGPPEGSRQPSARPSGGGPSFGGPSGGGPSGGAMPRAGGGAGPRGPSGGGPSSSPSSSGGQSRSRGGR